MTSEATKLAPPCPRHASKKVHHRAIDLEAALERIDGDRSLFDEFKPGLQERLPENYREDAPRYRDARRKSLESCAHTLKDHRQI